MGKAKKDIKSWKGNSFEPVLRKKKEYLARLNGVKGCIQRNDNYSKMRTSEKKLRTELNFILKQEEIMWFQRSRTTWMVDGN